MWHAVSEAHTCVSEACNRMLHTRRSNRQAETLEPVASLSDVILGSFPNIKQEPEHENAHLLTTIEHIPVEGLPMDHFMATTTQQPYAAPEADDAVGSDDDNWNETPVRKRHCVIPGDGNDVIRYTMHTADLKAVETITDLAKRMKDSLPPEQLVPAHHQNIGIGPMHSMRAGAYHRSDLSGDQTEAMARTSLPVQSSSSRASSRPQHTIGAFPTQAVQGLQEYFDLGTHYPSQNLKLKLAIKTVRHASTFFLVLDSLRRVCIRDAA